MTRYEDVDHDFEVDHIPATHPDVAAERGWGNEESWSVCLPHQCEQWEITYSPTKEQALRELDDFIAQAQAARAKLEGMD